MRTTHWPSYLWGAGMTTAILGGVWYHDLAAFVAGVLVYAAGWALERRQPLP